MGTAFFKLSVASSLVQIGASQELLNNVNSLRLSLILPEEKATCVDSLRAKSGVYFLKSVPGCSFLAMCKQIQNGCVYPIKSKVSFC